MTNLPATVQLSTLTNEITVLTERLAPAGVDAVIRCISQMMKAGMTMPAGIKASDQNTVYSYALDGVPSCGLAIATQKLIKGDYAGNPDILLGMVPKPPVLAALAKGEARVVREDLARKREIIDTITHRAPEVDRSPEILARVRAAAQSFKREYEAGKAKERGVIVNESLSAEKAEYYSAIMGLKDAQQITADQSAFRRKVEADLEAVKPEKVDSHAA